MAPVTGSQAISAEKPLELLALPPEILTEIFCQLPDVRTIKDFASTHSVLNDIFLENKKAIMTSLVQRLFNDIGIDLALPLLACRAKIFTGLEPSQQYLVEAFLNENSEQHLSKEKLKSISIDDCKQLFGLFIDANVVAEDICIQTLSVCPVSQNDLPLLSQQERCHIVRAICRWELWCKLFSKSRVLMSWSEIAMGKPVTIDKHAQRKLYLGRYSHWEQQQLGCILSYASREYDLLVADTIIWAKMELQIETEMANHRYTVRDSLVSKGPRVLAQIIQHRTPREKINVMEPNCNGWKPFFREVVDYTSDVLEDKDFIPPADESNADQAPYGFQWARAGLANKSYPTIKCGRYHLWYWGYAFWDEERLRDWGIRINGEFTFFDGENPDVTAGVGIRHRCGRFIEPLEGFGIDN